MTSTFHPAISVLHVATALSWRGGEQQVVYLISELAKKSIRQYVLCSAGSAMESYCQANQVPFFTSPKRSALDISFAYRIRKICNSNNISLVHTHDSHAHTFAVIASMLGNRSKLIVSRRVDFKIGNGFFSKFKYNHSSVSRILCVSDKIKTIITPSIRDPLKIVTVHSGIDIARFDGKKNQQILHREYKLDANTRIIGNVSALAPHKDFVTFIRTAAQLKKQLSNTMYFIIGEGDERKKLENLIRQENLQDDIIITGFRNDIPDIMPELDLMLITSETEGLGTTILDAFACRVPVVATVAGGIPEIVIHQQTGLLAAVGDVATLAQHVVNILNDEMLRRSLVDGASRHLENFTKEATAAKTLTEYLAVTGTSL